MPGNPRKRGKEVKTRGISKEQGCVATEIDRHGNIIMEMVCKGRIKSVNHKQGVYHIQHINALHSNLKRCIWPFNGVLNTFQTIYFGLSG